MNKKLEFENIWTKKEISILKQYYGKLKVEELEQLIPNRTRGSIQKRANRLNLKGNHSIHNKRLYWNDGFFEKTNNINSYWAGFIAADGNIGKQNSVKISLSNKDFIHLEKWKKAIKYTGEIKTLKGYKGYLYSNIAIWQASQIVSDLNKNFNITQNKTLTLMPPNLTKDSHIISFIAGYFDGDGCWFKTKQKNKEYDNWSVCGNYEIIKWIQTQLKRLYKKHFPNQDLPEMIISYNGVSKVNFKITTSGLRSRNIQKILQSVKQIYIYRMERKLYVA